MGGDLLEFISGFGNKQIAEIGLWPLSGLLLISLISSFIVSYLYVHFYKQRSTGSQIHRSFPMLGMSITAIFICIQFSLPLSLGLLGALSIVRFRTPIKEPEEIGFLMLLIATSISCATFNLAFLAILLIIATIGLLIAQWGGALVDRYMSSGMLTCNIPKNDTNPDAINSLIETMTSSISGCRIDAINENLDSTIINVNFIKLPHNELVLLKKALTKIEKDIRVDVFYNNQIT